MELKRPKNLAFVSIHEKAPERRMIIGAFIVLLYAFSLQWGVQTMGTTREWAIEEQKRKIREKATAAKEKGVSFVSGKMDKESELTVDEEELPSPFLPSAWACLAMFGTVTVHVLFHLMCVWSLSFKCNALFKPASRIRDGSFVKLVPLANKGRGEIVRVDECETTLRLSFFFQNQKYQYLEPEQLPPDGSELVGDSEDGGCMLVRCPVDAPLSEYRGATGITSMSEYERLFDLYGQNIFELPRPTFWDLYKKQLVSPIAIFQLFCAVLWMLDTYWKYTMFTFASILGFEASTAFQRLKSMNTLRGMTTKNFSVQVFRCGKWEERAIEELIPRDIVSLVDRLQADANPTQKQPDGAKPIVPCDCVIVRGSAVVNEASLTGESVPQLKDALPPSGEDRPLDIVDRDRIHTLFSGTTLIQVTPDARDALPDNTGNPSNNETNGIPRPPDGGLVCCVLRTGFSSSQGELVRMIEFSQENVAADHKETAAQLLFLLLFALVASGYVLKKGLEDEDRSTHKLLLRCTLIITSVVPPSLPMQMAFAVHTALMNLIKAGIYCTEPFRVPHAGRITRCFFDKTGTITSDQMQAVGVVNSLNPKGKEVVDLKSPDMASWGLCTVIAGCQSLIEADGKILGDPIELAAMRAIKWSFLASESTATPGTWYNKEKSIVRQKEFIARIPDGNNEADMREKARLEAELAEIEKALKEERALARKLSVKIEQRHHFSSTLQRMSAVCSVKSQQSEVPDGVYCLVKGSPEVVGSLCASKPDWYDHTYTNLAERGHRVLAFAYRRAEKISIAEAGKKPREWVEDSLTFAGFVSFKCETRRDSLLVLRSLSEAAMSCIMLTGDAPLTALSVAQEVGIASKDVEKALLLQESSEDKSLEWTPALTAARTKGEAPRKFVAADVEALSREFDLVVTGSTLATLMDTDVDGFQKFAHAPCVYARVSPKQKEDIIRAVGAAETDGMTLMCGDGGNDVGALKQANVGVALLSGYGNANVAPADQLAKVEETSTAKTKKAEDALAAMRQENVAKAQEVTKKAQEDLARRRRDLMSKQQQWVEEELAARATRGEDTGIMGKVGAMKSVMNRLKDEIKTEQEVIQKKHGNSFAAGAAKWAGEMDSMEDSPMVQLGDASTAAPFTTRAPSVGAVVDIVRQGRCTLLSAVQQMEIMMLESMIAAYTLAAMAVDGTRPSEAQMMASGTLISVASLAFSFAQPLDRMHPTRPLFSVFHRAIFFSMMGQLLIHLGCMVYISGFAKDIMGEEELKSVVQFEKDRNKKIESMDESAFDDWSWFLSVPFKPNLLNTVCWLVESSQQVSVLFVNYKGRPWMKGLLENQPLFLSIFISVIMVGVCAWGAFPWLNDILNLVVVPQELRVHVMITLMLSLIGSFVWDRLMLMMFAPEIFQCYVKEAKATTFMDFYPILKTVGMVLGGLILLGAGNPIMWGVAFMIYRSYKSSQQQSEQAAAGGTAAGQDGSGTATQGGGKKKA